MFEILGLHTAFFLVQTTCRNLSQVWRKWKSFSEQMIYPQSVSAGPPEVCTVVSDVDEHISLKG